MTTDNYTITRIIVSYVVFIVVSCYIISKKRAKMFMFRVTHLHDLKIGYHYNGTLATVFTSNYNVSIQ